MREDTGFFVGFVVVLLGILSLGAFESYMDHIHPTREQCEKNP